MSDFRTEYLTDMVAQFGKLRNTAERAIAQVDDEGFFKLLDGENNSIAIIVKHIAGNLRSRCQDFLTSDGEKPDRDRDSEFVILAGDSRENLMKAWGSSWDLLAGTVESLAPEDVRHTVYIRAQPHRVGQALNRNLSHLAYHIGQIVLLAKHWAGDDWQTLTIARSQSQAFTEATRKQATGRRPT